MNSFWKRKWPDGLCTSSVGVTHAKVSTFNSSSKALRLIFFPGRQNWLIVQTHDGTVLAAHGDDKNIFSVTKQFKQTVDTTQGEFVFSVNYDNVSPNNWRPVSYGLHICTSAQANSGWYIAKRVPTADLDFDLAVNSNINAPDMSDAEYAKTYLSPSRIKIKALDVFPSEDPDFTRFDTKGSAVGSVGSLGDAYFVLNPVTKKNEFTKNRTLYLQYPLNYGAVTPITCMSHTGGPSTPANEQPFVLGNLALLSNQYYVDQFNTLQKLYSMDPEFTKKTLLQEAFDSIVVYLFPDEETLFTVTTKIHQELLYSDSTPFRRDYTPAWYAYPPIMNSYLSYVSSFFKIPYIVTTITKDKLIDSHSTYFS